MKHVIITGSTRGIGFGLAGSFLNAGCKVTINGTSTEGVEDSKGKLKKLFPQGQIQGFAANVANYHELLSFWDKAVEIFGPVDIFINNAGINLASKKTWELSPEEIQKIFEINLLGAINGSKVAFHKMLEQGFGQIFNMEGFGSNGAIREKMVLYGTSKRAISYYTRALAKEAEGTPILIGTLSPGMVITDMITRPLADYQEEEREQVKKIFNILADDVSTVAPFLTEKMLANQENNAKIVWLTKRKIIWRFIASPFVRRKLI